MCPNILLPILPVYTIGGVPYVPHRFMRRGRVTRPAETGQDSIARRGTRPLRSPSFLRGGRAFSAEKRKNPLVLRRGDWQSTKDAQQEACWCRLPATL